MPSKIKIGITNDLINKPGLDLLKSAASNAEFIKFTDFLEEMTPEQIRGFDMAITYGSKVTQNTVEGNDQLVCILYMGQGYNHIDLQALTDAGIMLCNSPAAVRRPLAVGIMSLMLALATRLLSKDKIIREGRWFERDNYFGEGLTGKTLGSIGVGNVGHELFVLARPFGMKHIVYDPYVKKEAVTDIDAELVDLDTVLAKSDFLNISVPLNTETKHMIGREEFRKMKPSSFLINTSRGAVLDESELIKNLQEERIRGAALDVFEQEPISSSNPLLKMENVIVTPHCIADTDEYFIGAWQQKLRQFAEIMRGEIPEAIVNREVMEKPELQAKLMKLRALVKNRYCT